MSYMLGTKGKLAQPKDRRELVAQARHFRDEGIDVLAVNGGDGTLHLAVTAFVEAYGEQPLPPIAILRGGTMNTIASGLGISGSPADILSALLLRYHTDQPLPLAERHALCIEGSEQPEYGFLFGNGLLSNFLEEHYTYAEPSPLTAAWLLARAIASAVVGGELIQRIQRPAECEVTVDGTKWPGSRYLTVCAGSVDDIGLGFRPFFESLRHPGRMHAVGFACTARGVVKALPAIWMARPIDAPDVYAAIPERMVIHSERAAPFMVDGDFHPAGQAVTVSVGPKVRFVLP